jgi:hypothetical protein
LRAEAIATRQGEATSHCEATSHWKCAEPRHLYKDELLDHVVSFLSPDVKAKGSAYFKLADATANKWFHRTEIQLGGDVRMPVEIIPGLFIELFLSPQASASSRSP